MQRFRNGLLDLWDALLGRKRIPRNPDDAWTYTEQVGRETGELESHDGAAADTATTMHPVRQFLIGFVTARIANLTRRLGRRLSKVKAASKRHEAKAEQHGSTSGVQAGSPARGVFDFFASRVVTYLLTYGLTIWVLELTGMLTSSVAFETALGQVRIPLSVAAGAILLLAGHVAGHLIHAAKDDRNARRSYLIGAAIVLVTGTVAVAWLGTGRDANTGAVERFAEAGGLRNEASRLDDRAADLLRPLPNALAEETGSEASAEDRRAADELNREAEQMRRQARQLDADARGERTLSFLVPVQLLGLVVGCAGGFFFAGAAPLRKQRVASRHRRRAEVLKAKANGIQGEVASLEREEFGWAIACHANAEHSRRVARGSIKPDQTVSGTDEADLIRRMVAAIRATNGAGDSSHVPDPEEKA